MDEGLTSGAGRQRLAAILVGLGVIVFVTGAVQARTAWFVGDALPLLISGGMLGLILAGLGATVFVSAALQGEWRSLDHLEVALRRRAGAPSLSDRRAATTHDTAPGSDGALPMATRIRLEGDRIGGWLLAGLGVAVLLVTSRLVAHEVFAAAQVAYITSGGLTGCLLVGLGSAGLVTADLRDTAVKVERLGRASAGSPLPTPTAALCLVPCDGVKSASPRTLRGLDGRPPRWLAAPLVIGLVLIGIGWRVAAQAWVVGDALNGLAIGLAGVGVVGAACSIEVLRRREPLRQRIGALVNELDSLHEPVPARSDTVDVQEVWTADGLHRFHQRSCAALTKAGGERRMVDRRSTELEPCLLCDAGA